MENYIFYCYKEWLEAKEGNLFKQLSRLTVCAVILLVLLFATLIALLVVFSLSISGITYTYLAYILMGVEVVLGIIISIYSEKFQIAHSRKNLKNYEDECNDLENLLSENYISLNFISTLIERYEGKIRRIEERIDHKHNSINKFMEMLLIPTSAIIIGAMLDKEDTAAETLSLGISGLLIVFFIYGAIIFALYLYDIVMRIPEGKYKQFVTDLQSIIDFKECGTVSKSNQIPSCHHLEDSTSENTNAN